MATRVVSLLFIVAALLLLVAAVSSGDGVTAVDGQVWRWLTEHRTTTVTRAAVITTQIGSTVVLSVVSLTAAVWLIRVDRREDAILVAVVAAGAGLLVTASKTLIARSRPPEHSQLVLETTSSFPSGHALGSMAILAVSVSVVVPCLRSRGWRVAAWIWLGLSLAAIGASRLYLGVHWPTDVAAGWLIGAGWWLVCLTLRDRMTRTSGRPRRGRPGFGEDRALSDGSDARGLG